MTTEPDPMGDARRRARDRFLSAFLIFLASYLFVLAPLMPGHPVGRTVLDITLTVMLVLALFSMTRGRTLFVAALTLWVLGLGARVWLRIEHSAELAIAVPAFNAVFLLLVAIGLLTHVLAPGPVNRHRLRGAIAVYLLIGLAAGFGFVAIDAAVSDAFTGLPGAASERAFHAEERVADLVYFSFVTLTTLGYGDVTPIHPLARSLALFEALFGPFYLAVLVARLVSERSLTPRG